MVIGIQYNKYTEQWTDRDTSRQAEWQLYFKTGKCTIVRKMPNSGSRATLSPSEKMKAALRSFLAVRTMAICCAATDKTGSSMRLNSSKQPHDPDCARPLQKMKKTTFSINTKSLKEADKPNWAGPKQKKKIPWIESLWWRKSHLWYHCFWWVKSPGGY